LLGGCGHYTVISFCRSALTAKSFYNEQRMGLSYPSIRPCIIS
jgi:hypothetical protein